MLAKLTTRDENRRTAPLPLKPLEAEMRELSAHLNAGLCRWLELVRKHEEEEPWYGPGLRSYAHWLSWRCGVSVSEAREYVRVAHRLDVLPLVKASFARGELSYAKVRLLTRVADPRDEEALVRLAGNLTTAQLQRIVQVYRRVTREQAADAHERSFVNWLWDDDGSLVLRARLPAEEGAVVLRAIEAARQALRRRPHAEIAALEGRPPDPLQMLAAPRNVDALVAVADAALATDAKERPGADRCQIVVHVDADTLTGDDDGRCQLEDGPAVNAETVRRLACDASLVRIIERDGKPLSVGRKTRTISHALRRALRARDRCCRFPGCNNTRLLHAHHVEHWARGGETSLDNLIFLCGPHHRLVHEGGYSVGRERDGGIGFRDDHGRPIPYAPPRLRGEPSGIVERNRHEGLAIDGHTAKNGVGERLQFNYVGDVFIGLACRRE